MIHGGHFINLPGILEVICGPMFSGKTEELIRRTKRAQIAKQKVQIFKPAIDDRYDAESVVSHSSQSLRAMPIKKSSDIFQYLGDTTRVVAIDELQFFDAGIVKILLKLARRGIRVICAGLDQDYKEEPFGVMPEVLALADHVTKLQAICTVCGGPATKTFRKFNNAKRKKNKILVGEKELYEARCRIHYEWDESEAKDDDAAGEEKTETLLSQVGPHNINTEKQLAKEKPMMN